jgi:hypothetical protein
MRAKVETMKLGRHLAEEAQRAREKLAADTYGIEAVRAVCTEAAGNGYPGVTIKPPAPLDLVTCH